MIYSNFWEARNKWFNIGLGLNLEVGDLKAISQRNRDDVDDCFRDMLEKWLRTSLRPMQSNLITVLREKTVGFNQLAEELESKILKRDRVIHQLRMASKLKTSPTPNQIKIKSVIKIGAPILILLITAFMIWKGNHIKVKEANVGQHEVSYQPSSQGRHQLHIKVKGKHKIISGVKEPWGVAVNNNEEILVAEGGRHCISIFNPTREKLRSFGSQGSGPGQFREPYGVTVDDDGNILVADSGNHRIQKFTSDNKYITSVGGYGSNHLQFMFPVSVSFSPITKKVVVSDFFNHRVQILNPDLTFNSSIGSEGSGNGEFSHPHDIAFDSAGNMYVVDTGNDRIQVFNLKGEYLWQFGKRGKSDGELDAPTSIYIDNIMYVTEVTNHRVSLFTLKGEFLTSFGSGGDGPGQFDHPCGITVDKQGTIYVADVSNDRIQLFIM